MGGAARWFRSRARFLAALGMTVARQLEPNAGDRPLNLALTWFRPFSKFSHGSLQRGQNGGSMKFVRFCPIARPGILARGNDCSGRAGGGARKTQRLLLVHRRHLDHHLGAAGSRHLQKIRPRCQRHLCRRRAGDHHFAFGRRPCRPRFRRGGGAVAAVRFGCDHDRARPST